jgi:hypothetical protein
MKYSNYQVYVGDALDYHQFGTACFNQLLGFGCKSTDYVLDIGAGSLKVGKSMILYLEPGYYHAIEPEKSVVDIGCEVDVGPEVLKEKSPVFYHNADFEAEDRIWDFAYAYQLFIHCGHEQLRTCLSKMRAKKFVLNIDLKGFFEEILDPGVGIYHYEGADFTNVGHSLASFSAIVEDSPYEIVADKPMPLGRPYVSFLLEAEWD